MIPCAACGGVQAFTELFSGAALGTAVERFSGACPCGAWTSLHRLRDGYRTVSYAYGAPGAPSLVRGRFEHVLGSPCPDLETMVLDHSVRGTVWREASPDAFDGMDLPGMLAAQAVLSS